MNSLFQGKLVEQIKELQAANAAGTSDIARSVDALAYNLRSLTQVHANGIARIETVLSTKQVATVATAELTSRIETLEHMMQQLLEERNPGFSMSPDVIAISLEGLPRGRPHGASFREGK